jgi:hypothetical protein
VKAAEGVVAFGEATVVDLDAAKRIDYYILSVETVNTFPPQMVLSYQSLFVEGAGVAAGMDYMVRRTGMEREREGLKVGRAVDTDKDMVKPCSPGRGPGQDVVQYRRTGQVREVRRVRHT